VALLLISTLELFQLEPPLQTVHILPLQAWPLDQDFREMIELVAGRVSSRGHFGAAPRAATCTVLRKGVWGN
jgi:hypothetical protein